MYQKWPAFFRRRAIFCAHKHAMGAPVSYNPYALLRHARSHQRDKLLNPIWPILLLAILCIPSAAAETDWQWRHYGADAASTKFAPISQIDSTNFDELRMIWRRRSPDEEYSEREDAEYSPTVNQNTPLVVDGVLYTTTSMNIVAALDAATGRELWTFDPGAWKEEFYWNVSRGVAYWSDGEEARILYGTGSKKLFSLDAKTGRPDPAFGDGESWC